MVGWLDGIYDWMVMRLVVLWPDDLVSWDSSYDEKWLESDWQRVAGWLIGLSTLFHHLPTTSHSAPSEAPALCEQVTISLHLLVGKGRDWCKKWTRSRESNHSPYWISVVIIIICWPAIPQDSKVCNKCSLLKNSSQFSIWRSSYASEYMVFASINSLCLMGLSIEIKSA